MSRGKCSNILRPSLSPNQSIRSGNNKYIKLITKKIGLKANPIFDFFNNSFKFFSTFVILRTANGQMDIYDETRAHFCNE